MRKKYQESAEMDAIADFRVNMWTQGPGTEDQGPMAIFSI